MFEFEQLAKERNSIMIDCLQGKSIDFSKLRTICKEFNQRCSATRVFEVDGTDQQLWESVNSFFHRLLKKS